MYVRKGTILVLGKEGEKRTVFDWANPENHEVRLYEPNAESSFTLYDAEGTIVADLKTVEEHGSWKVKGAGKDIDVRVRRMSRAQNY